MVRLVARDLRSLTGRNVRLVAAVFALDIYLQLMGVENHSFLEILTDFSSLPISERKNAQMALHSRGLGPITGRIKYR